MWYQDVKIDSAKEVMHETYLRQLRASLILSKFFQVSNKFASFLISTSLFLAMSGAFKVLFSGLLFDVFAINTAIMAFLTTFSTYGLNKLTDLKEDAINTPERADIINKIGPAFKCSVCLSFIIPLIHGFLVNVRTLPVLLFPLFIGILYSVKFIKNIPRLKDITGVKNITIALSWAVGSTFLPAIYYSYFSNEKIILIFYLFFLKSYINTVLFDARDIEGDSISGVRTIPVLLGRRNTKKFLLLLNSTFIPWLIFSDYTNIFGRYLIVFVFSIVYGYWYILYFCREGVKIGKMQDLLVDGEWIPTVIFASIFA